MSQSITFKNTKKISDLTENSEVNSNDKFMVGNQGSDKIHTIRFINLINLILYWTCTGLNTTVKTLIGALNELKSNFDDGSVTKVGTSTVGSGTKPIYLSSGTPTASSSTVGSGTQPMYLSSGTFTASGSTVGSALKPMYVSSGTYSACSNTIPSSISRYYLSQDMTVTSIDANSYASVSYTMFTSNLSFVPDGCLVVRGVWPARIIVTRLYISDITTVEDVGIYITVSAYLYCHNNASTSPSITVRLYGLALTS